MIMFRTSCRLFSIIITFLVAISAGGHAQVAIPSNSQSTSSEPVLVILVQLPDAPTNKFVQTGQNYWANTFFGPKPSVSDYFATVSYGQADLIPAREHDATGDGTENDGIVGWIGLTKSFQEYQATGSPEIAIARDAIFGSNVWVDYESFDINENGYLEVEELHVFVIVSAYESTYKPNVIGDNIKIRRVSFPFEPAHPSGLTPITLDGVIIGDPYHQTMSVSGEMLYKYERVLTFYTDAPNNVGLLAHELGHHFRLPEHYERDDMAAVWCLMGEGDFGSRNRDKIEYPTHICAPHKIQAGWLIPTIIKTDQSVLIQEIETNPIALKLWENGNGDDEYFILENRNVPSTEEYDRWLPSSGLLIWHVDSTRIALQTEPDQGVALEQADNEGTDGIGNSGDAFSANTNANFLQAETSPNSRNNSEKITGVAVANISTPGQTMAAEITVTHEPVAITLTATSQYIKADGISTVTITSNIIDRWNEVMQSASNEMTFSIISGSNSGNIIDSKPVNAVNGIATIQLQSTSTPGIVTIEVSSPGLPSGKTNIIVFGRDFGLVAHWSFDDGTAIDSSNNGNHGSLFGGPEIVGGKLGNALKFDGRDDYVQIPTSNSINSISSEFTVCGWLYPISTYANFVVILTKGNTTKKNTPYAVNYVKYSDFIPHVRLTDSSNQSFLRELNDITNCVTINQWSFFAWRFSKGRLGIFRDGVKLGEYETGIDTLKQDDLPIEIGRDVPGDIEFLNGILDEVYLYNRALAEVEIQELYNLEIKPRGLIAFYPFNGNANDESGNGHNGAVLDATLTTDRFGVDSSAYYFSGGSGNYIHANIPVLPLGNNERTLCVWAKSDDGLIDGNSDHIANWGNATPGNAFGLMLYLENHWWGYGHEYQTYDTNSGIEADTSWHFLCCSYGNDTMKVYVDGNFAESSSMRLNTIGTNFYIGIRPDLDGFNTFDGIIDDIRIYDRVLTNAEIQQLYILINPPTAVTDEVAGGTTPQDYELFQSFPNPFLDRTVIKYKLPKTEFVALRIYNSLGQLVRLLIEKDTSLGFHETHWDGTDKYGRRLPGGIYLMRMQVGDFSQTKKILLLR